MRKLESQSQRPVGSPAVFGAVDLLANLLHGIREGEMGTAVLQKLLRVVLICTAGLLTAAQLIDAPSELRDSLFFFSVLVFLIGLMRVRHGGSEVGFGAGAIFPAIVLFGHPAVAIVPAAAGLLTSSLIREWFQGRRDVVLVLTDTSRRILAYAAGAFVFINVAGGSRELASMALGYLALVATWIVVAHALAWLELAMGEDGTEGLLPQSRLQAKALMLLTPLVAVEILVYPSFGIFGLVLAFLPVLLVAYVMRNEADAEERNLALSRRNRELNILRDSSASLLSAEGNEETFRRLTRMISTLLPLKACTAISTGAFGPMAVYRFGECHQTDQTIVRWASSSGLIHDIPHEPVVHRNEDRTMRLFDGDAKQLVLGVQTVEVIQGVLVFETDPDATIDDEILGLISLLVSQAAVSIQDQTLKSDLREQTRQLEHQGATLETILEVSKNLIGNYDADLILSQIATSLRSAMQFEIVVVGLLDEKQDVFVSRAQAGLDDIWDEVRDRKIPAVEMRQLMRPGYQVSQSYFIPSSQLWKDENFLYLRKEEDGLRFQDWTALDMLLLPLFDKDRLIGYISAREQGDGKQPDIQKMKTLEIFASQAVAALQSARQYEEIHRLTQLDPLTAAYNHRYFQDTLRKEIYRHQRLGHGLAVAMIDIDDFKAMNDTYGHPAGDAVLRGLVDELSVNVRDIDIVCRYGGEEFAIIFPETPADKALEVMIRLRACVAGREFPIGEDGKTVRITVSSGVAVYPQDGSTAVDLVGRADFALYEAKRQGKNAVVMAQSALAL